MSIKEPSDSNVDGHFCSIILTIARLTLIFQPANIPPYVMPCRTSRNTCPRSAHHVVLITAFLCPPRRPTHRIFSLTALSYLSHLHDFPVGFLTSVPFASATVAALKGTSTYALFCTVIRIPSSMIRLIIYKSILILKIQHFSASTNN